MAHHQVDSFSTACTLCGKPVHGARAQAKQHVAELPGVPGEPVRVLVTIQDVREFWCPHCLKGWVEACPPAPQVGK